jgi:exosortase/archaeosortase family protein
MSLFQTIKTAIQQIPAPVKTFLWRALAIFIVWELVYSFFLIPDRIIDRPLSMFVGNSTASFIGLIKHTDLVYCKDISTTIFQEGNSILSDKATIFIGTKRLIGIADGCNGLSLFVLFIGFIIAYPGKIYLKMMYSIVGVIFITFLNVSRCTGLALVNNSYPHLTDFAHHYVFKIITYLAIFYMWYGFVKINNKLIAEHA